MIFVVLGYFWSLLWEVINNRVKLFLVFFVFRVQLHHRSEKKTADFAYKWLV
jgi:hypothetical protein